jgi:hypothetical protein
VLYAVPRRIQQNKENHMSNAKIGAGTQLKVGDGASPENFLTVPEMKDIELPEIKIDMDDVSNQDSAIANGLIYKEYIVGLADGTEATFTGNYLAADTTQALIRSSQNGKLHNFKIVVRDPTQSPITTLTTFSFAAYVTSWQPKFPIGKAAQLSFKLKVSGPIAQA